MHGTSEHWSKAASNATMDIPLDNPMDISLVPEHGQPGLVETARTLFKEYAALAHVETRWLTVDADIAALPLPYVSPTGALLIASVGNNVLGCGALRALPEAGVAELKRIYVRYEARGAGVGKAITLALIEHAARLGFTRVRLDTAPELYAARALYGGLGFVPIPQYSGDQLPNDPCYERDVHPQTTELR